MTSERKDEEWKGKLTREIGKQETRCVFGSLPAMTGESFESNTCTCLYAFVCIRVCGDTPE